VESIPFTETRDYVQAILRNEAIYRELNKVRPAAKDMQASEVRVGASGAASATSNTMAQGKPVVTQP
jgi:hypothetical protein